MATIDGKCPYRSMHGTGTGFSGVFLSVWVPSMDLYKHLVFLGDSIIVDDRCLYNLHMEFPSKAMFYNFVQGLQRYIATVIFYFRNETALLAHSLSKFFLRQA